MPDQPLVKPKAPPIDMTLEAAERVALEDIALSTVTPHRGVVRAQVILMVANGPSPAAAT